MKNVIVFDLDDTLTKEIDFLKSGYNAIAKVVEISCGISADTIYKNLIGWYYSGKNAFECLNKKYNLNNSIEEYLKVYRFHKPKIKLSQEIENVLDTLKNCNIELCIISDGRFETQMNKIDALGLKKWISEDCIIINSLKDNFKPNATGYMKLINVIQEKYSGDSLHFTYVGDNLKKDFIWPNANNWATICLKNDGRNIHSQDFENTTKEALPQTIITGLGELIKLYKQ